MHLGVVLVLASCLSHIVDPSGDVDRNTPPSTVAIDAQQKSGYVTTPPAKQMSDPPPEQSSKKGSRLQRLRSLWLIARKKLRSIRFRRKKSTIPKDTFDLLVSQATMLLTTQVDIPRNAALEFWYRSAYRQKDDKRRTDGTYSVTIFDLFLKGSNRHFFRVDSDEGNQTSGLRRDLIPLSEGKLGQDFALFDPAPPSAGDLPKSYETVGVETTVSGEAVIIMDKRFKAFARPHKCNKTVDVSGCIVTIFVDSAGEWRFHMGNQTYPVSTECTDLKDVGSMKFYIYVDPRPRQRRFIRKAVSGIKFLHAKPLLQVERKMLQDMRQDELKRKRTLKDIGAQLTIQTLDVLWQMYIWVFLECI